MLDQYYKNTFWKLQPYAKNIGYLYNVERYIRQCLDSVVAQTFQDFEVVIVDDGSRDSSAKICDEYALQEPRIRVVHQANSGVSAARNCGMKAATGDYITFIDADDFVSDTYLEGLYLPIAKNGDLDFVHGGCCNYQEGQPISINQQYDYHEGDATSDAAYLFNQFRGLIVSKLFRRVLLQGLQFDWSMKLAEDMAFTLDYILRVETFAFVEERGYFYRRDNTGSATKGKRNLDYERSYRGAAHIFSAQTNYIRKHNLAAKDRTFRYQQASRNFLNALFKVYQTNASKEERLRFVQTHYIDNSDVFELFQNQKCNNIKGLLSRIMLAGHLHLFDFVCKLLFSIINTVLQLR